MVWQQQYAPGGAVLSFAFAASPLAALLIALAVLRKQAWVAILCALICAAAVAIGWYRMPLALVASSLSYGGAFGLFPIGWIVFSAILLHNLTVAGGHFEDLKQSLVSFSSDRRIQTLLIGFAFGAFLEGAAGFGAPVAIAASMLTAVGFEPFYAAGICLLANTAPVAFGSLGIPVTTLAAVTGLPAAQLSASVGRICAPVSCIIPMYLIFATDGWKALRGILPVAFLTGLVFGLTQFLVSNFMGPELTDILSSSAAITALLLIERTRRRHPEARASRATWKAWIPYLCLVAFVLSWGLRPVQRALGTFTVTFAWPALHNQIERMPPVITQPVPYAALYSFNWLAASGTACFFAVVLTALVLRTPLATFASVFWTTVKQLWLAELTIAMVLALAFLMNYSGATATLGIAFAATGLLFPFFSALLGWLGVFLTGSDTAANALFGNLQVVSAQRLGLSPTLMAAANSSGGVMGKMISLTSIAVACAATGLPAKEATRLFRFTLRHSVLLAVVVGFLCVLYSLAGLG